MAKQNRDCSYQDMSDGGKQGGQSITKVDNSIHSEYYDEHKPFINNYENSRKSFYGPNGFDHSGMKGSKR